MHLQCDHCDRTFTKTEHLRRHERSHTKEKPFGCHVCKKSYARSDVLARHMRMHQRKEEGGGSDESSPPSHNGHITPKGAPYGLEGRRMNGHVKQDSTSYAAVLDAPERYNMPPLNDTTASYASGRTPFASFGMPLPTYATQPSQPSTGYPASITTPGAAMSGASFLGLSSYGNGATSFATNHFSQDRYQAPVSEPDFHPSPIEYAFPTPAPRGPAVSEVPSPFPNASAIWPHPVKDAMESNVRGSGIHHSFPALSTQPAAAAADYGTNGFLPTTQAAIDSGESPQVDGNCLHRWLKITEHNTPVNSILMLGNSRGSTTDSSYPPRPQSFPKLSDFTPLQEDGHGRYPKVEQSWYKRMSSQGRWGGAEKHWYDIMHGMKGDLFNSQTPTCQEPPPNGSRVLVSEACRMRMIHAIYPPITNPYNPASVAYGKDESSKDQIYARFPSCAAFDEALKKYFDVFWREAPFLHMPVFSISTCHPLLLFVMSCIGFGLQKKKETCHFVQSNFTCIRDRILTELERNLASTIKDAMSIFATSFIFLKLAALINDRDHLSPCQLLYVSLVSLAQMHGMFSEYGKRTSEDLYRGFSSLEEKWMAWGRVESLKRISVSLLRLDSAYATFLRSHPTVRVNNIELPLPCDDRLFEAPTAEAWFGLIDNEQLPMIMPAMTIQNSLDKLVGCTYLNYYSLHAVLNYLQLRSLDAYSKLVEFQSTREPNDFVLVPFQFYCTEPSLRNMTLHIIAFIDSYETLLPRFATDWQRTNCLIFWHFLCLSLVMNQDLFEIAAGREGPTAAASTIDSIALWSKTAAARRALIHSAAIYRLLSERKSSEMSSLYAAFGTFAAALVMTLFAFANQAPADGRTASYELTAEVHWQNFGLAGLDDSAIATTGSAAETFILRGGPCHFLDRSLHGFSGAKYVLTRYADMLKNCGRYNYKDMCRVLMMMHELLSSTSD